MNKYITRWLNKYRVCLCSSSNQHWFLGGRAVNQNLQKKHVSGEKGQCYREREKIIRYEIVELCLEIKYLKSSSILFLPISYIYREKWSWSHFKRGEQKPEMSTNTIWYTKYFFTIGKSSEDSVQVVCYCSVGYRSSALAQELLSEMRKPAYEEIKSKIRIYNLEGSIFKWANEGKDLEDSRGRKTTVAHPYSSLWGKLLNAELRCSEPSESDENQEKDQNNSSPKPSKMWMVEKRLVTGRKLKISCCQSRTNI